jgi:glyoxylase-like metal-dependent hydrolase (beta-lactamase superfamily II)
MSFTNRAALLLATAFVSLGHIALGQAPAAPPGGDGAVLRNPNQTIVEVKKDLYLVTGAGGDSTVLVTKDGILLVDSKNAGQENYDRLLELIRRISPLPVKVVINTHHHGDHTGNNARFIAAGAKVIGLDTIAGRLAKGSLDDRERGREHAVAPNAPYSGSQTEVQLGGETVRVYHFGNGHTDTDSVVYFPGKRTVATGDLYVTITPGISYNDGGTLLGTRASIKELLKLDFDTVIPGHGLQAAGRPQIERYARDLDLLIDRATQLIEAGVPKEELLARIKSDDLGWSLSAPVWSMPANVASLYAELANAKP